MCPLQYLTASSSLEKVLTSTYYPFNYPLSTTCTWRITAPYGYNVQLSFTDFNTYSSSYSGTCSSLSHYLQIDDSSSEYSSKRLGKYCGSSLPAKVVSSGRYLYLKFVSSSYYNSRKGFRLLYKAIKDLRKYIYL